MCEGNTRFWCAADILLRRRLLTIFVTAAPKVFRGFSFAGSGYRRKADEIRSF
jgi:hypothetical protein